MKSSLEQLAADVRHLTAPMLPRAAAPQLVTGRAPAGKRDLPRVAGTAGDTMGAQWDSMQYRHRMSNAMRRGHAVREVVDAAREVLNQRVPTGAGDDAVYIRLNDAVRRLEGLPR